MEKVHELESALFEEPFANKIVVLDEKGKQMRVTLLETEDDVTYIKVEDIL